MPKFMAYHTLPEGLTHEQVCQVSEAAQKDPVVRGLRSFITLSEGKAVCLFDSPSKDALGAWFQKMGMPYDSIHQVELMGECGSIEAV